MNDNQKTLTEVFHRSRHAMILELDGLLQGAEAMADAGELSEIDRGRWRARIDYLTDAREALEKAGT